MAANILPFRKVQSIMIFDGFTSRWILKTLPASAGIAIHLQLARHIFEKSPDQLESFGITS